MRRAHIGSLLASLVLMFSISACSQSPPASQPQAQPPAVAEPAKKVDEAAGLAGPAAAEPAATATAAEPAEADKATTTEGAPGEKDFEEIDPNNFDRPTTIDNKWFPLIPGTQYVYEGSTEQDGESIPHRVIFTVTDLTKEINGIRTLVVYDSDFSDGVAQELELTYFAQDNDGNVWHLGQYYELYDAGEFLGGRLWYVGLPAGAKAGIMMQANPQLGTPSYSEGYSPPPFSWTDRARVFQMGQRTTVITGSYEDVLVVEEFSREEPGAKQLKYYAQGVGVIRVGWAGTDDTKERLELAEHRVLSPEELAEVRQQALTLEEHAYMYCTTSPAEQMSPSQ